MLGSIHTNELSSHMKFKLRYFHFHASPVWFAEKTKMCQINLKKSSCSNNYTRLADKKILLLSRISRCILSFDISGFLARRNSAPHVTRWKKWNKINIQGTIHWLNFQSFSIMIENDWTTRITSQAIKNALFIEKYLYSIV
jgi:hypothetical protein